MFQTALQLLISLLYNSANIQRELCCKGCGCKDWFWPFLLWSCSSSTQASFIIVIITVIMLNINIYFSHYVGEFTAEITSVRPGIPIKNFEDVLHHDYKVVANLDFYRNLLATAGSGSAKHQVYKKHLENAELWKNTKDEAGRYQYDFLRDLPDHPRTLLYAPSNYLNEGSPRYNKLTQDLFALEMDDEVKLVGGHAMQKNSEFLPIFNHYLRKQYENGLIQFLLSTGRQFNR